MTQFLRTLSLATPLHYIKSMKLITLSLALLVLVACGKEPRTTNVSTGAAQAEWNTPAESCDGLKAGDVFMAADGINSCQCNSKGVAMCTLIGSN